MSRDPSDNPSNLPPWLRNIPLPPRPAGSDAPAAAVTSSGSAWLEQPAPDAPASHDDTPDWLRGLSETTPAVSASSANDVPDWLRSEQPTAATSSTPTEEVPDWLREPTDAANVPSWLSEIPSAPAVERPNPSMPDWMSEAAEMPASEPDVPEWLRAQPPLDTPPAPPAPPTNSALWLDEPPVAPKPADVLADPPAHDSDDEGVPSWLRDISMDEVRQVMADDALDAGITATPFTFEGASESTRAAPTEEVPSWLGNISESTAGENATSWLDTLTTEQPPTASTPQLIVPAPTPPVAPAPPVVLAPQPVAPAPQVFGATDWLRDIGTPTPAALSPGTPAASPETSSPPVAPAQEPSVPDWLREIEQMPGAPAGSQDAPSTPTASPEAPSWLRAAEPTATAPPGDDLPDWMRPAAATVPAADAPPPLRDVPSAPASVSVTPSDDMPPWLREATPAAPAPSAPASMSSDDDIPAWLRESSPATAATSAGVPTEQVPDWLRAAQPTASGSSAESDLPPWLRDVEADTLAPSLTQPVAPPEAAVDAVRADAPLAPAEQVPIGADLPAWLRTDLPPADGADLPLPQPVDLLPASPAEDMPPWLRDETGAPLPTTADASLPAWLRGVPADAPPAPPALLEPALLEPALPAWAGTAEATPAPERRAERDPAESEFLGGADLPAWLRPQEVEKPAPIAPADARSLNWLTRITPTEDESGTVEEAPEGPKLALPQPSIRTAGHNQALALLERLAAEPFPAAAALPAPAPASLWQRIGIDRALYVLLLITLLITLAVPSLVSSLQAAPVVPSAATLFQQLDTLTNQDVVLVGYEWDARRVSEMHPLEQAVLGHLIKKGVKLVLVSTDPQGTLLSYNLRDTLSIAGYNPGGSDYILLGYKPGGELALRQLAQSLPGVLSADFQGNDANIGGLANGIGTKRPLRSLKDFSAILVLADDPVDVQGWMEQIHRSAPSVPIAFMLPEETAPISQPYMRQPNVFSLAGKVGALAYENMRGDLGPRQAELLEESGQQRLGLLVFVVLFIIGALVVGITNVLERRRKGL